MKVEYKEIIELADYCVEIRKQNWDENDNN